MAKRFLDTDIWNEDWFLELSQSEKMFWFYLFSKCDHAGIWRPNFKMFELQTGHRIGQKDFLNKINNLEKTRVIVLKNGKWWLTGFIPFQYGSVLNTNSHMHKSILTQLENNYVPYNSGTYGFEVLEGSRKGQRRVTDTLKDKDKDKDKDSINSSPDSLSKNIKTWRDDFEIYKQEAHLAAKELLSNKDWIAGRDRFHPNLDIALTIEKAWRDYWETEAGWKNKKSKRTKDIDWTRTANNALTQKCNHVWKKRAESYCGPIL